MHQTTDSPSTVEKKLFVSHHILLWGGGGERVEHSVPHHYPLSHLGNKDSLWTTDPPLPRTNCLHPTLCDWHTPASFITDPPTGIRPRPHLLHLVHSWPCHLSRITAASCRKEEASLVSRCEENNPPEGCRRTASIFKDPHPPPTQSVLPSGRS